MAKVIVTNLTKVYRRDVRALAGLNLEIADGELLAVVGPSGCGKTTTLRLIAGLETATDGRVEIGGRDVTALPPRQRHVAMVFQKPALYGHLSVEQNLAFGLRMRRVPRHEITPRVREIAELLEVADLLERRPHELSGGQQQRIALGRALVHKPDCFLLDEPLSHLDPDARRSLRGRLRDLHAKLPTTMIYVTHDQAEATALGDRVAVLRDGVLQQCADPMQLYRQPANQFVAGFVGEAPMNFLGGRLVARGDSVFFERGPWRVALPGALAAAVRQKAAAPIVLGIRPEAIRCVPAVESDGGVTFSARIAAVEPHGDHVELSITTSADDRLLARIRADRKLAVGDEPFFSIDVAQLQVFHADDAGRNVLFG